MKILVLLVLLVFVIFSVANAELFNRGTDSLGNRLIYDDINHRTWYDYIFEANWYDSMSWAENLDIDFGGNSYTDWRLPNLPPAVPVYSKPNISDLGLLENALKNFPSPFLNFQPWDYWTSWARTDYRYIYSFSSTRKILDDDPYSWDWAIAVRSGDVAPSVVPEPISSTLFIVGGVILASRRYLVVKNKPKRKKRSI